jgi:hypothetical protein
VTRGKRGRGDEVPVPVSVVLPMGAACRPVPCATFVNEELVRVEWVHLASRCVGRCVGTVEVVPVADWLASW